MENCRRYRKVLTKVSQPPYRLQDDLETCAVELLLYSLSAPRAKAKVRMWTS